MSNPNSTIYVLRGFALDNRYEHTFWFKDKEAQEKYFTARAVKVFRDYTYIRRSWDIKVSATMEEAREWSYLMFRNGTGKMYYYFINHVEYINDETVHLFIEMDVIQTYMFDWGMRQCFVERCHTVSDEIGEHIVEEGLETGPLTNAHVDHISELTDMYIMVMVTTEDSASARMYDGVFSGLRIYAVDPADYVDFGAWLDEQQTAGKDGAIVSMWMYPKKLTKAVGTGLLKYVAGKDTFNITLDSLFTYNEKSENYTNDLKCFPLFDGYKPKNNKLYSYPYNFLYADNNSGGSAVLKYEDFMALEPDIEFNIYGCISPDGTVRAIPLLYAGLGGDNSGREYGITLSNFPSCAWDSDGYKVWLAQNQNSQNHFMTQQKIDAGFGVANATLGAIGHLASADIGGAVSSVLGGAQTVTNAYMQIEGLMAQRRDMDIQPPQARGNFSSTLNVSNGFQTFSFYRRCIKGSFAEQIDDYFTRYGYKVNKIMLPNIHARERFTYIKTVGCLIDGRICNEDRVKIENIFDRGITFWDPDKGVMGIYLGDNPTL